MRQSTIKVWHVLFTLLAVVSAVTLGTASAVAAEASVRISEAGIQARGAGLVVEVSVVCPAGSTSGGTTVTVSQAHADKTMTFGSGSGGARCTGAPQVARVVVLPFDPSLGERSGAPFRSGVAFVSAKHSYACLPFSSHTCSVVESARTVELRAVGMNSRHSSRPNVEWPLKFTLLGNASLQAGGAGVAVRFRYRCTAGFVGFLSASLWQRTTADAVTGAPSSFRPDCSGAEQTGVLVFRAQRSAFETGVAFVELMGDVCMEECFGGRAHRTVSVA